MNNHHYDTEKVHDNKGGQHDVGVYGVEEAYHTEDLSTTHMGDHGTKRDLPPRVVSMIAIAGTIGTGLFLGSGSALTLGGPVGMWLGYTLLGFGVACMMISLGEMTCYRPNIGGFIEMGAQYVDPALGFTMGFNYIAPSHRQKDPNLLGAMKAGAGTAAASPFVVVCKTMGVKVLPHIINGVVVTSALSSGNEQIYALSRIFMAMARNRLMPQLFLRTTKRGVPWPGVIVSCLFGCLAFLSVSNGSNQAFTWLTNLSALSSLFTWIFICISYVRFKKALEVQGIDRSKLVLTGYFQPYLAWVCIVWFSIILILNGFASFMPKWNASDFFAAYITIPLVILSYFIWKLIKRTKMVPYDEMDLSGGPPEAMVGTRYDPTYGNHQYR